MVGINPALSINALNGNGLNILNEDRDGQSRLKSKKQLYVAYKKPLFILYIKTHRLKVWRKIHFAAAAPAALLQSCPTLCVSTDCSPPGSSVHGILQARMLEWVAVPSSRGSSRPRERTHVSYVTCIGRQVLYN